MSAETRMRSASWLLAAKCLSEAPTPCDCRPRTSAEPSTPDTIGSSERYSKLRPHSGERLMLMPGPSSTPTPSACDSSPSATPTRSSRSGSNDEPSADGGREARGRHAVADAEVVGARALLAHAVRAVGEHDRRQADALDGLGGPEARAAGERCLLLEGEVGHDVGGAPVDGGCRGIRRRVQGVGHDAPSCAGDSILRRKRGLP